MFNASSVTMTTVFLGYSMLASKAFASDTPKLDELKAKHNLADPNRNHTSDNLTPEMQAIIASPPPSKDLTAEIAAAIAYSSPTKDLGLAGKFPTTSSFSDQTGLAINIGQTHGQPTGNVVGNQLSELDVQYSRSGTRKFVRDPATGELKLQTIEGVPRVSGLMDNELFSEEINNTNYNFQQNKQTMHGDDTAIFDEGKITHDSFKDASSGQTGAARGYRVITSSATQANNTAISENAPWLQPSFNAMAIAEDGESWLDACTETTVTSPDTYNYQTTTEYTCTDTSASLLDYCQVERILEPPLVVESSDGITITSCGDGCIDISMGNSTDNGLSGSCDVFTKTATLGINPSYAISNVTLSEAHIDDHAIVQVDGVTAWSLINGSPGSSGSFSSVSRCETNTSWKPKHTGNMRAALINAQSTGDNAATIRFDTLVDRGGEGFLKFRIRFTDPSGNNFKGEFIQEPEGCFDALTNEARTDNPLTGVYDGEEILPPQTYTCSAPKKTITCPLGKIAVDNGSSQTCYDPALETISCPEGAMNEVTEMCEMPGTYSCPFNPLGYWCGGIRVIAPEPTLVGDECIITDQEHCGGGWSQVVPATLSCNDGFTDVGGICGADPLVEYTCADTSEPGQVVIAGETYSYCTDEPSSPSSQSGQTWSCSGGESFSSSRCDITLGGSVDTAICYYNELDSEYVHPISFCTFDGYSILEEGSRDLPPSFLANVPPFFLGDTGDKTWKVNLDGYRCDPTDGNFFCRTDPITSIETCMTWEEFRALPNQCQPYINDIQCSETLRTCNDGWLENQTGRCMADSVTFECVEDNAVPFDNETTTNICTGMLPCSGNECDIGTPEANTKFIDAMVAGSIADNLQGDATCTDASDPTTCELFPGEFEYCSWEVTGLGTDCCEKAKGVDVISYITLSRQLLKVNQMADAGAFGDGVMGVSNTLSEPITSSYDAVANWAADGIRSASETLFGNAESVSGGVSVISEGINSALASVQQAAFKLIYDIAPDALKNFLFDNAAAVAEDAAVDLVLNESITQALSTFMAIYTVYNLTKLALTLLTACDDNEIDMSVKLAQRQCFTVGGSYCSDKVFGICYQKRQNHCCYSSILARIIMKEAYNQLPINPLPFGNDPSEGAQREASCPGLTAADLAMLDFNTPSMKAGLQEWTGLLLDAGQIPTETSEAYLTGGAVPAARTDCPLEQIPRLSCFVNGVGDTVCEQQRDAGGNLLYDTQPSDCGGQLTGGSQIFNAAERQVASERIAGPGGYIGTAADRAEEAQIQMRALPGAIDCTITPRPPLCRFGFDPTLN
jgi:hypothetical protein